MQPTDDRFDDESRKFLQDVKKGKPRKFLMIKDGVQINKLILFKVGTFDRALRRAKQDGTRGEAYWGVLHGNGTDINFELSRADGFIAPPGTNVRLKEFLREAVGLKLEPTYMIVDNLASVDDTEDDGAVESSDVGDSIDDQPDIPNEDAGTKFERLLQLLLPHANRALAMDTTVRDELQAGMFETQELGRNREFQQGLAALRNIGELIKRSLAESEPAMASAEASDAVASRPVIYETRSGEWDLRFAQIEPRFRRAIHAAGANAEQLQKVMDYARTQARNQQFVKALVGLNRVERMLADIP